MGAETQRAAGLTGRTIQVRHSAVRSAEASTGADPRNLTGEEVQQWLSAVRPDTLKGYATVIRAWFVFLAATGRHGDDPLRGFDGKAARAAAAEVVAYARPVRRHTFSPEVEALIAEWTSTLIAAGMQAGTINTRTRCVRTFGRGPGVDLLAATPAQIVGWPSAPDLKAWSRATYYASAASWFGFLVQCGVRQDNPVARLRKPRARQGTPRPLGREVVTDLLASTTGRSTPTCCSAPTRGFGRTKPPRSGVRT